MDMRHPSSDHHPYDGVVGLQMEKKGVPAFASLDGALHDSQEGKSWSWCPELCVSHLRHQHIWGQRPHRLQRPVVLLKEGPGTWAAWETCCLAQTGFLRMGTW